MPRRWILLIAGLLAGCAPGEPGTSRKAATEPLRIAAASDLQAVMPRLIAAYRAQGGGEVVPTFGSSGQLARQIEQGAPFDLFLSADLGFVEKLAKAGVVEPESVAAYAVGSLALVIDAKLESEIRSLADLAKPVVKVVAIANPDVAPYGRAARQALQEAKVWDAIEPRVVRSETVRQAFQFVKSGNAEAALVSRSLTVELPEGLRALPVDAGLHSPLVQGLGVVSNRPQSIEARKLAAWIRGEEARKILAADGFAPPPGE